MHFLVGRSIQDVSEDVEGPNGDNQSIAGSSVVDPREVCTFEIESVTCKLSFAGILCRS